MTEKTTSRRRRVVVAAAGAVALGLTGLMGATPAHAAPVFGDINPATKGSITVHKHENQVGDPIKGDPAGPGATLPNPIENVTFEAYPLTGINLTTNQGWTDVNDVVVGPTCDATLGGTSIKGTAVAGTHVTNNLGITTFTGLDVGAYLLCETDAPASVVTRAQPFVVTIPFPDNQASAPSNSNGWLYDVHVYPKNTLSSTVTKSIAAQGSFGLGSTVTFPITATVPRIPANETFTEFSFVDQMDGRLGTLQVVSVQVGGSNVDAANYATSITGNTVSVWFTQAGLAWLKGQGGASVVVTLSGVVTDVGNGTIPNTVTYRISHEPGDTPPPVDPPEGPCDPEEEDCGTTPPVHTNWGDLKLLKVDAAADPATPATLAGAKFKVYAAADPYATDCSATAQPDPATAVAIMVNGVDEFTSDGTGIVNIPGLFVSDSVNPVIDAAYRCYWVQETVPPAGFVLPPNPWTPVQVVKGATATYDWQIENTKTSVPELPLTGAQGQALLLGGGALLILVGGVLFAVSRRRATL